MYGSLDGNYSQLLLKSAKLHVEFHNIFYVNRFPDNGYWDLGCIVGFQGVFNFMVNSRLLESSIFPTFRKLYFLVT